VWYVKFATHPCAEVKMAWPFISTHIRALIVWCLIMCRDKFYVEKCPILAFKYDTKCCCFLGEIKEGNMTL
jgi:hypothetical protein